MRRDDKIKTTLNYTNASYVIIAVIVVLLNAIATGKQVWHMLVWKKKSQKIKQRKSWFSVFQARLYVCAFQHSVFVFHYVLFLCCVLLNEIEHDIWWQQYYYSPSNQFDEIKIEKKIQTITTTTIQIRMQTTHMVKERAFFVAFAIALGRFNSCKFV